MEYKVQDSKNEYGSRINSRYQALITLRKLTFSMRKKTVYMISCIKWQNLSKNILATIIKDNYNNIKVKESQSQKE